MKRTVVIALVVLVAAVAAWSVYAYAQGGGPLKRAIMACQPACDPSTQPCDKAQACHDGTACACDPAACPEFKDANGDSKCDIAGDCERSACGAESTRHCGRRMSRGHGCSRGFGQTSPQVTEAIE